MVIDVNQSLYSVGSEIIARIAMLGIPMKTSPVRIGAKTSYSPSSKNLIKDYYISTRGIEEVLKQVGVDAASSEKCIARSKKKD